MFLFSPPMMTGGKKELYFDLVWLQDGLLRVGGHQVRLRSGMPNVKQGIANLKHTDLDSEPAVPGCSLLLRILPASEVRVSWNLMLAKPGSCGYGTITTHH